MSASAANEAWPGAIPRSVGHGLRPVSGTVSLARLRRDIRDIRDIRAEVESPIARREPSPRSRKSASGCGGAPTTGSVARTRTPGRRTRRRAGPLASQRGARARTCPQHAQITGATRPCTAQKNPRSVLSRGAIRHRTGVGLRVETKREHLLRAEVWCLGEPLRARA